MENLNTDDTLSVGELREWLARFPDDLQIVIDDDVLGHAVSPASLSGSWRVEQRPNGGFDYWRDDQESAEDFADVRPDLKFSELPFGIVIFPR